MTVRELISHLFLPPIEGRHTAVERRRANCCFMCQTFDSLHLVFMSDGHSYCESCARAVAQVYGYQPAGKRADDIKILGEAPWSDRRAG